MSGDFVHLHTHSEYSLLDGLGRVKDLVAEAKRLGHPALAITDHGAMHGAVEFFRAAKKAEIKPIIGLEAYQTVWGRPMGGRDGQFDKENYHLLMLARNMTGYRNLLKISSNSHTNGFYYKPRIDHDFLEKHAEGLIATTGCLGAEVPQLLEQGKEKEAYDRLGWYVDLFGKENFFIEIQEHNIPELVRVNKILVPWADKFGLQMVVTNDVHYVKEEDGGPHDVLLCVQTSAHFTDEKRMRLSDASYFMKSRKQLEETFRPLIDLPASAYDNSLRIAEMCEVDLEDKEYHLPDMPIPEGYTYSTYLRHLTVKGLAERYGEGAMNEEVQARMEKELRIIDEMGFAIYFLIVADLCDFARSRNIWWNVRGSGAGSIVAYCIGITGLDPLKNNLIFERFLNPGRVTMPDFDLDYPDDQREELIRYTIEKYGSDQVAQIVTFGRMKARAAIRDVGRVKDIPLHQVDRIAKLIPGIPGKPVTIRDVLTEGNEFYSAELVDLYKKEKWVQELLETSMQLEGVARHSGIHAAAVIVADRELSHYTPLMRGSKSSITETVTQYEFPILESIGLLKVDFLGLSTLSVMREAGRLIRERHGIEYKLDNMPFEGEPARRAFDLLSSGEVSGVFQVESQGMRRVLTEMRPTMFEHIIATISLYRPGPIDYIPVFIRRMHGDEPIEYKHKALESVLAETYGIIVYQEQIIQILSELAGYTPGEADLVRRAISKKKASEIERHKNIFVQGCAARGIPKDAATDIYADIEFFARYGFNKCLPGDTEIVDPASGRMVRIEDLYTGAAKLDSVVTCDIEDLTLRSGPVAQVIDNGIKPVFHLTTASGRQIEATANHPFYTFDGWRLLEEISPDDLIAVPRSLPVEGNAEWPDHEVIALGHLLAEGEEIPAIAFELTNRQIGLLLSRMWEGDGHLNETGRSLFCATASERMARQMQHLFLRLGILSRLRTVEFPYKEGRTGYQLFVTGNANLAAFAQKVGVHFVNQARRTTLDRLVLDEDPIAGTKDIVPLGVKETVRAAKAQAGVTWSQLNAETGVAQREFYPVGNGAKTGYHRNTIGRLADYFAATEYAPDLRRYADNDIYWDRVVEITPVGEKQTYDLEVPGTHNFIANDILVHNSHAADYAVITVQTAFLKATYPVEYMAALLLIERDKTEKVVNFISECRRMGIQVLPPDVNYSGLDFEIQEVPADSEVGAAKRDPSIAFDFPVAEGSAIRYGMAAVKNVGAGPVQVIIDARNEGGPFKSLEEFCDRTDLRAVGKRALECLFKVGAFDRFGKRSQLLDVMEEMIARSAGIHIARDSGQLSMFDLLGGVDTVVSAPIKLPDIDEAKPRERLAWERELVGVFVTSHPLEEVAADWQKVVTCSCAALDETYNDRTVVMAGMINSLRTITTKKGDPMAFVQLEDLQGQCEVVVFPRTYAEYRDLLEPDNVILVKGKAQSREGRTSVLADSIQNFITHSRAAGDDEPPARQRPLLDVPTFNGAVGLTGLGQADDLDFGDLIDAPPDGLDDEGDNAELVVFEKEKIVSIQESGGSYMASAPQTISPGQLYRGTSAEPVWDDNDDFGNVPGWETFEQASPVKPGGKLASPASQPVPPQSHRPPASQPSAPPKTQPASVSEPKELPPKVSPKADKTDDGNNGEGENENGNGKNGGRTLHITFHRSGNLDRDKFRLKEIYERVRDPRGKDHFSILVDTQGQRHLLQFPNDPCTISDRLTTELEKHFKLEVNVE